MALLRAFILAALILATTSQGHAAPVKKSLGVTASVIGTGYCILNSTQDISFGALNPLNAVPVQATGNVSVVCLGFGTGFTVGVSQVTPSPLTLKSGSNTISYYLEAPTSATSATGGIIVNLTIPIKADIPALNYKYAPAGSYSDTVTLQINP
jgi:spore coat protein U-like protein